PVGNTPAGVAVTPDGSRVYVINTGDDTVSVIDTATNTVVNAIPVGKLPNRVAITPDGSHAYVTNTLDNSVSVIAIDTGTSIPGGGTVYGLDGRVLDITDDGVLDGTPVQMWDFTGAPNQQWIFTSDGEIRNPRTDKCLNVEDTGGGGQMNGSRVQIDPCNGSSDEKWTFDPEVTDGGQPGGAIINQASGKCLDVADSRSENGVPVQVWDCTGEFNQQWNFV
ncbi:ricin-type beta-trefoil lectin domain protein, partial [Rhodococcus marinonascens]|uniref:ricin-type beta-trefoil lectin domain protein n=1 Tax=Rhodococcus marinonascens TaxID=38311 RepID=UPI000A771BA4